uniref:Ras-GEF domain-containing protein n=1 Tax=Syphacia muris TaxID=451379 RepID=A0A0N5APS1_9BILA
MLLIDSQKVPLDWYLQLLVSWSPSASPEFSKLSQLLQYTDADQCRLPKRFQDEEEVLNNQNNADYINRLSITGPESVLESTDVCDWLVLRVKDGATLNEVRGGPADALIAFATQPSVSPLYQEAFLTTYRTFISSYHLIQKLIKRYNYMIRLDDVTAIKVARQCFSALVRIVDDLCCVEMSKDLISTVNKFSYSLVQNESYTFAKLLRQSTLFEFRSSAIAKQMTLLDADLFQKIEPPEMLWWAQEQDEKKSPNLCAFTEHFNKVSYWVRTMVIRPKEQRIRDKYLLKYIKIMKQLRSMGNYNSYLAVLSALESGPIRRLEWPKNCVDMLKEHSTVMDSTFSFKNYRNLLTESRPPCLPYLGLVLQDLTFVHIGNPDYLSPKQCQGRKNLLNYGKRWQQFTILDSIRRFKSWNYCIEKDEKILQLFGGFKDYLSEDDIWELSESIKPRSRKNKT